MVLQSADKDRIRTLLKEAIPRMCKSGLPMYQSNFEIEALVGITLDQDVFLVSIKETIKSEEESVADAEDTNSGSVDGRSSAGPISPSRAKRKRKRSKDSSSKKSRPDAGDQSSSESDNETAAPSPTHRLETQPVLALEETSLDTAIELNQTIANTAQTRAKIKQEAQESDSDSDDLVVVKEEQGYNYGNSTEPGGGGGSVFPGINNTLSQASSSFGLPPFQSPNMSSQDLQAGPSLDMPGQLLPQQDPQQVGRTFLFLVPLFILFKITLLVLWYAQNLTKLNQRTLCNIRIKSQL